MPGAKRWVFTLNNPTDGEHTALRECGSNLSCVAGTKTVVVSYLVWGREKGERGTFHLQGYVCFDRRVELGFLKKALSARAFWEVARGTADQASAYCKKDGHYEEFGSLPGPERRRTDFVEFARDLIAGASIEEIRDRYPGQYVRFRRTVRDEVASRILARTQAPRVICLWGDTGTGKTSTVYRWHKLEEIYKHSGTQWFDGYTGQPVALFDDFTGGEFKLGYMLQVLDRYPMIVPIKGGFVQWRPSVIYVTSNINPCDWYPGCSQRSRDALLRRFQKIVEKKMDIEINSSLL